MHLLFRIAQVFNDVDSQLKVPKTDAGAAQVQSILQVVFQVTGVISVLIITIAGFTYILSGGDPQRTARAKDAILYAIIGVVVSISAYAIVTFVLDGLFG